MSAAKIDPRPERFEGLPAPGAFSRDAVIRELDDGLVLRRAGPADAAALIEFNRVSMSDPPDYALENHAAAWTQDLVGGEHPRARIDDFILVEDAKRGRIASSLCLLSHRLRYGCCELSVGQPELVGTHPGYRRRGLVRAMFDEIHRRSDARGDHIQLIDGIPWFYHQFGYTYAIERFGRLEVAHVIASKLSSDPGVTLRAATESDIDFMTSVAARLPAGHNLVGIRDRAHWEFELRSRHPASLRKRDHYIVEKAGRPAALLVTFPILLQGKFYVTFCAKAPDFEWDGLARSIVVHAKRLGNQMSERDSENFETLTLTFGSTHPFYAATGLGLDPEPVDAAFYVRCSDIAALVRQIAPELERRLSVSDRAGFTGTLELCFYRDGLRIGFRDGTVERVEKWKPLADEYGDASFPDLTFLQLLFGYRSLPTLRAFSIDCQVADEETGPLLEALFPPGASAIRLTD